jgi:hypothetical protein
MTNAVGTYEEKARDHWLFDYPAQVSLCGTQIWWTTEVGIAFSKLEEGYENAIKDYYKKQVAQLNNLITRPPEDHDHLHHRCALQGCHRQAHRQQDRVGAGIHVAVAASTSLGRRARRLLR